jgi:hypothetical protein
MTPAGRIQDLNSLKGHTCQKGLSSYATVMLHKSRIERERQVKDIMIIVKMSPEPKHIIENAVRKDAMLRN